MTKELEKLNQLRDETNRFLVRLDETIQEQEQFEAVGDNRWGFRVNPSRPRAAAKRASLDLSAMMASFRKGWVR